MTQTQIAKRLEELEYLMDDCCLTAEQYAEWQALGALVGDE